jgi:hypothetical protein
VPSVHLRHDPSNCSQDTGRKVHASYVKCPYFLTIRNKLKAFVAGWGQKWISKNIPAMLAEIQQVCCHQRKVRLIIIYRSVVVNVCGVTDTNSQDNHTNVNQDTAERVDFCECKVPLLTNCKDTYNFCSQCILVWCEFSGTSL